MQMDIILKELAKQKEIITNAMAKQDELLNQLKFAKMDDYDWVPVTEAAKIARVSVPTIYRAINSGKLKSIKHFGSKKYLRISELMAIDEKYEVDKGAV